MNYEAKMRLLQNVRPEKKDILLYKLWKGETVDITKDESLFYQINADRMPIEKFVDRPQFLQDRKEIRTIKEGLVNPKYGKSKEKKLRCLGEIPYEIYFTHPWFSLSLSREERDKNIRKFFNMFPEFRFGSSKV